MKKKNPIWTKHLNAQEFRELVACGKDIFFFVQFIFLIHPKKGKVRFDLYPFQKSVILQFLQKRFNIILKFRQAGITELIAMYCLWYAMFFPNKNIQIISIKERTAKKVLRKIKYMYKNLPAHLQQPIVNGRSSDLGTSTEIEFANGSTITSIPTTEEAGRGEAAALLVIDEAAILRWAGTIWASAFPTLSTGGNAIVNSTPYGVGNWFHKQWQEACSSQGVFNPIRLKWPMHPERDINWYNEQRAAMGARRTAQEVDGDFLGSGASVFNLIDIKDIENTLQDLDWVEEGGIMGDTYIYKLPVPGERYYLGGDVATGRARDYSTVSIYNDKGEGCLSFKAKLGTNEYSKKVGTWGRQYNDALVAIEAEGVGEGVNSNLQDNGYPNLYYSEAILKKKGESKREKKLVPGFLTKSNTRPIIIDELERDIALDNIFVTNPFFVAEAYTFIYDETNRPVAMGKKRSSTEEDDPLSEEGFTDDAIFGEAIANKIRKTRHNGPLILPQ